MKPVFFAVLTAVCWSVGGFFEKKGLRLGDLSPVMGITIRTATAMLALGVVSFPGWSTLSGIGLSRCSAWCWAEERWRARWECCVSIRGWRPVSSAG